ncbi:MAG TPA: NADP-dependent isocitrate dehydrogenase [Bryobacteraceae bacterium]|nr:NADP-dependent isocitrate dehydrogenase [Bryobacteraceae bacterium]
MSATTPITVAYGDGIGPEIMRATLRVLEAAGAGLAIETIEIGEKVYLAGNTSGIEPAAWESLRRTKVFLKAPITTPKGGGYKSLNVTARKALGLYANVRPCVSYHPFVETRHENMDVVIIRENEEDLYAGIEYRMSGDVMHCLKLISRAGCERIVRYAFEYARRHNRRKVSCFTKDNIMRMTDGLFHRVFEEIAAEYSEIQSESWTVDIGAAKLADTPEAFDVVVLPNLYGDILSEVAAQIAGSIGLAGSANIGQHCAMFEALHGSAPRRAGQNLANPSGLILAAVLMLVHIDKPEVAALVHNAWLRTIEDGIHTYDIFSERSSTRKVGTQEFAEAVIARLGQKSHALAPVRYNHPAARQHAGVAAPAAAEPRQELVGVDVYVEWRDRDPAHLAAALLPLDASGLKLSMISNRGVRVWPEGMPETLCSGSFQCRFLREQAAPLAQPQVIALLQRLTEAGFSVVMVENLREFDGQPGFSLAQGE